MGEDNFGNPTYTNTKTYTSSSTYALSGKIMLSAIIILFTVVVLIISLHVYARCFLVRARRRNALLRRRAQQQRRSTTHLVFVTDSQTINNPSFVSRGLEASVLKALPTFVFSAKIGAGDVPESMECAVCLSEFEENEMGRLLPKCSHSFHSDCIDMWFLSHSTCPICRSPVNNASEPEKSENPQIEIVIESEDPEPRSSSSSSDVHVHPCQSCRNEEIENGSGSSSSSSNVNPHLSVGARRKVFELVGVSIEVPKREGSFGNLEEEIQSCSPGSSGFRSPGSRIMALKRILSREKRSPVSARSFCGSVAEIEEEKGHEEEEERRKSVASAAAAATVQTLR